ncbi:Endonuclease/exonuclease/phosphatase, partial [Armillaria luteobubalina]
KASLKIAVLNIRGLGNVNAWHPDNKWNHINQIMNTKRIAVLVVGEAHLNEERKTAIENMPRGCLRVLHSEDPVSPNARGITIVLNKSLTETENIVATEIIAGRALLVETCWHRNEKLSILGVYAPVNPVENTRFWGDINEFFLNNPNTRKPDVMAGDMNVTEDPIDQFPACQDYIPAVDSLDILQTSLHLIDGWQNCYPTTTKYTWQRPATGPQSRLDRIYVRSDMNEHCFEWNIEKSRIPTDHDMVSVRYSMVTAPQIGHGRWAMPLHIVRDHIVKGFIIKAGRTLQDDVEKYSKPENHTPEKNPQKLWEDFSKELRTLARERAKVVVLTIDREIRQIEMEIMVEENSRDRPQSDEPSVNLKLMALHTRLDELTQKHHKKWHEAAQAQNMLEGEVISKYWSGIN